jgi:hypothetical protein
VGPALVVEPPLRKTEQRRPILAAFLDQLQNAHRAAAPVQGKKPRKAAE